MSLRSLSWILLLVAALALAAWWGREHPALQRLLPESLHAVPQGLRTPELRAGAAAAAARKCRGAGQLVYTDGACPAGTREEAMDGGAVTVLPAQRPPAAAAPATPGASAQTPLRRLAGPDDNAALRERVLEQALHR